MRKWARRLGKIVVFGVLAIALLIGAGAIYEQASIRNDMKSYTPSGKLYKVHGENMHVYTGGQGDVTVVMVSGWGTASPYVDFSPLYERLAPHVKFAVYDRFGYGYSDTTDKKRDIDTITDEIHDALKAAGQKPPYLLAAHSLGALETIRYAQKYPDEVQGIVMIDGGSPEYYNIDSEALQSSFLNTLLIKTGVIRMLYQSDGVIESSRATRNGLKYVPDDLIRIDQIASMLTLDNANIKGEFQQAQTNAKIVLDAKQPFSFPLTILTADYFGVSEELWTKSQAAFTSWSLQPKQIVVKDAEHYVHQYQPDLVAEEILSLAKR
ncbi:alpha/beta hydrolase [Paenibacillus sp. KS-LC4]|uniref:alpha/beta fold hydrolase n=1 Tax=Paenibacillus sp. KS-LC4 TaxID=2979727 RepID=UPI0030D286AE